MGKESFNEHYWATKLYFYIFLMGFIAGLFYSTLDSHAETADVPATATFVKVCPKGQEVVDYECKRGQTAKQCKKICGVK